MQEIIMKFILIILAILGIYLFYLKKNKYELILNGRFWIFVSWMTIFILYFFSGIKYKFNLNLYSFGYIILCLAIFFVGQYIVKKNVKENKIDKDEKNKIEVFRKTNFLPLFVIAFISVIIYTIYIIKINNIKIGVTRNINTNGIATILLLFSNSSLVIWLYELAYAILSEKKMTWYGLMSGVIYNIPGIVISGRDALMIFFVSTVIVLFYCGNYGKKVLGLEGKMYKKILRFLGVCLLLMMFYLIFLSNSRYGSTQEATIQMFKWSTDCQFPEYLENIYYKGGKVGSLILNIVFYYSSQLSKFSLIFENYNGPYLFGFYQLHYISRLLPDFMGMNFTNVTNAIQQIATNAGTPGIKVFWETAIGYSIYDFGKIGTLFISLIEGMLVEKINTLGKQKEGIISILIRAFICIAMFLTVEVSPLFDYYYIFPLFWLIIIVLFEKRRKSS